MLTPLITNQDVIVLLIMKVINVTRREHHLDRVRVWDVIMVVSVIHKVKEGSKHHSVYVLMITQAPNVIHLIPVLKIHVNMVHVILISMITYVIVIINGKERTVVYKQVHSVVPTHVRTVVNVFLSMVRRYVNAQKASMVINVRSQEPNKLQPNVHKTIYSIV